MARIYGDFVDFERFWVAKNKTNQTQSLLAHSTAVGLKNNLKKQSQFVKEQIGVKSVIIMVYGDFNGLRRQKNKAKQSQSVRNKLPDRFYGGLWMEIRQLRLCSRTSVALCRSGNKAGGAKFPSLLYVDTFYVAVFFVDFYEVKVYNQYK